MDTSTPMITLTILQLWKTFLSVSKDTDITRRLARAMSSLWLNASTVGGVIKRASQKSLLEGKAMRNDNNIELAPQLLQLTAGIPRDLNSCRR